MSAQRYWNDVVEGEALDAVSFPLTVCRLVIAAGANRDFNAIHHNAEYARGTGAADMYANNFLLQGMWERCVRNYVGPAGVIRSLRGFRMRSFNTAGQTVNVTGHVVKKWLEADQGFVELELRSENGATVSVGPGRMTATLPLVPAAIPRQAGL